MMGKLNDRWLDTHRFSESFNKGLIGFCWIWLRYCSDLDSATADRAQGCRIRLPTQTTVYVSLDFIWLCGMCRQSREIAAHLINQRVPWHRSPSQHRNLTKKLFKIWRFLLKGDRGVVTMVTSWFDTAACACVTSSSVPSERRLTCCCCHAAADVTSVSNLNTCFRTHLYKWKD